jgi:hypothetical protein
MVKYLYFQSIVQYRVPVSDSGTIGEPEIIKKFTTPVKGAQERVAPKKEVKALDVEVKEVQYF